MTALVIEKLDNGFMLIEKHYGIRHVDMAAFDELLDDLTKSYCVIDLGVKSDGSRNYKFLFLNDTLRLTVRKDIIYQDKYSMIIMEAK